MHFRHFYLKIQLFIRKIVPISSIPSALFSS